ncbi:hypothetical protein BDR06DRAFT_1015710 [Suillus hirtellus]|nr:hypothetical protein BDR06DRAFT_1015710 [Suillus hirtellus]
MTAETASAAVITKELLKLGLGDGIQYLDALLSAGMFLTDINDKKAVTNVLAQRNITYNAKLISQPKWILTRVCRYVPPPEILFSRVAGVVKTYGPLKDATT